MRHFTVLFLISLLSITTLANITGHWIADWQNDDQDSDLTIKFTITGNKTHGYVLNSKDSYFKGGPLHYNKTENAYRGTAGLYYNYSASTNTLSVTGNGLTYLFSRNGSYFFSYWGLTVAVLTGNWTNPVLLGDSDSTSCAGQAPELLQVQINEAGDLSALTVGVPIDSDIGNLDFMPFAIMTPSSSLISWDVAWPPSDNYSLTVTSPTSLPNIPLIWTNNSCSYSYQKSQPNFSGAWHLDWETPAPYSGYPTTIQFDTVNNTYTTVTYTLANGSIINSYMYYTAVNQWFEVHFCIPIDYEPTSGYVEISDDEGNAHYFTSNGSLYSSEELLGNFTINGPNGTFIDPESSCCYADTVSITGRIDSLTLTAVYTFNSTVSKSPACANIVNKTNPDGPTQTTLKLVSNPSYDSNMRYQDHFYEFLAAPNSPASMYAWATPMGDSNCIFKMFRYEPSEVSDSDEKLFLNYY